MDGINYPLKYDEGNWIIDSTGESVIELDAWLDDVLLARIAACLNACRDISTEDLELCGEDAFNRNWNLRRLAQDAMFNSGDAAKGE